MFLSYLRIALRQLRTQKSYSAINIAGLAIGIASCLLMLLYLRDEMTFDAFHDNSALIYRILSTRSLPDHQKRTLPFTMGPLGPEATREIPGVASSVRLMDSWGLGRFTVGYGAMKFY
jgi:putative ABC transport system permease protein